MIVMKMNGKLKKNMSNTYTPKFIVDENDGTQFAIDDDLYDFFMFAMNNKKEISEMISEEIDKEILKDIKNFRNKET